MVLRFDCKSGILGSIPTYPYIYIIKIIYKKATDIDIDIE